VVRYWDANLRAVGAWALAAPVAAAALFLVLRAILRRLPLPIAPSPAAPAAPPGADPAGVEATAAAAPRSAPAPVAAE
jgi:hypothetical protein